MSIFSFYRVTRGCLEHTSAWDFMALNLETWMSKNLSTKSQELPIYRRYPTGSRWNFSGSLWSFELHLWWRWRWSLKVFLKVSVRGFDAFRQRYNGLKFASILYVTYTYITLSCNFPELLQSVFWRWSFGND